MDKKILKGLVLAGPTAVGKTNLSIKLAKLLNVDIISADSMQIYKEMNIGTAKITNDEMQGVTHHMIDIISPIDNYSVGDYDHDVNAILEKENKDIMLVGGTGLYIRAITDGLSSLPARDDKLREELEIYDTDYLQIFLKKIDLESYDSIDINNRQKLIRAIEVYSLTGEKFSTLKQNNIKNNNYNFLKIFITRDRDEIYERINKRVDMMIDDGLVGEARALYVKYNKHLGKVSTIGYKELFDYFDKKLSLQEAIDLIKQSSRRYAKRQITWFKNDSSYELYNLSVISEDEIMNIITNKWNSFV